MDKIRIENIKQTCCIYFNTTVNEIESVSRTKDNADARKAVVYIVSKYVRGVSQDYMAKVLGNRDRTTIVTSLKRAKEFYNIDKDFREKIDKIEKDLQVNVIRKTTLFYDKSDYRYKAIIKDGIGEILELEQLTKDELIYLIQNSTNFR